MNNKKTNLSDDDSDQSSSINRIAMISTHGYVAAEPPLGAPDTGGQVVYVLELSKVLARLGYQVDIFTRRFENFKEIEKVEDNVRIIRIGCGNSEFIPKEYMIEYIDEWVENAETWIAENSLKYEFINSHYWDAGWAGHKLSGILSIPHVHTPHSLGMWKKKNMEKDYSEGSAVFEKTYNFTSRINTEKILYNECEGLVATTPIQKNIMIEEYNIDEEKIKMIPPGYDDNKFYPMAEASKAMLREKFDLKENGILALSRLAHNKGLDLLVEAFNVLIKNYHDADLYLAIGHEDRSETEEKIFQQLLSLVDKYDIAEKVHFIGFIADEDLADFYQAADMFVLSSRYEPFGMTAVEAMACGTPTIVTKHGGLSLVLEDGVQALLSDPFDAIDMAIDMAAILKHEGIAQHLSAEGSKMAREKFSWTQIADNLLNTVNRKSFNGE